MSKPLLLLLTAIMVTSISFAQDNPGESFYVLDANWKGTTIDKAIYFCRLRKIDDTTYRWDNYNMFGPLVKIETFKDKNGDTAHGLFVFFHPNGWVDSSGHFFNGRAQGTWYIYNDSGKIIKEKKYDNGVLISTRNVVKDRLESKKDSVTVDGKNFTKVEVESGFKGKVAAWQRYLEQNLRYPDRAMKSNIQGDVVVSFIIDKDGKVIEPGIIKSVEYSLDEEALRIIRQSNKWTPAIKDGQPVKSYKIQPIAFRLQ